MVAWNWGLVFEIAGRWFRLYRIGSDLEEALIAFFVFSFLLFFLSISIICLVAWKRKQRRKKKKKKIGKKDTKPTKPIESISFYCGSAWLQLKPWVWNWGLFKGFVVGFEHKKPESTKSIPRELDFRIKSILEKQLYFVFWSLPLCWSSRKFRKLGF